MLTDNRVQVYDGSGQYARGISIFASPASDGAAAISEFCHDSRAFVKREQIIDYTASQSTAVEGDFD